MSRIAKHPITLPKGVESQLAAQLIKVKGPKGELSLTMHKFVKVNQEDGTLRFSVNQETKDAWAQAGTARALVNNMVNGVNKGFEKKLSLVGVGYKAEAKPKLIVLNVGFSHPVEMTIPEGLTIATPSPTEIVITGADKQLVGQMAANIRSVRPPEPYKGKGIRYADEQVERKEAKK